MKRGTDSNEGGGDMKRYFSLVLLTGVLAGSMHLSADEAISLTVTPAVAVAHQGARLKVVVARNEMNRALIWEVDGRPTATSAMRLNAGSPARICISGSACSTSRFRRCANGAATSANFGQHVQHGWRIALSAVPSAPA
jgi:hypothetical protein